MSKSFSRILIAIICMFFSYASVANSMDIQTSDKPETLATSSSSLDTDCDE